ncbi:MAG: HD domain-containing protein [Lachnospiraceae bacterium]|nr:HD domain-containing protein [Lachnospiraceae bacterium]
MLDEHKKMVEYLRAIFECRDVTEEKHCRSVRRLVEILAERVMYFCPEYNLTEEKCEMIACAGALHDVGKVAMSDRILQKPGRLSYDEFEIMKNHTRKGRKIFENIMKTVEKGSEEYAFLECCAKVCMYHHERYDGDGYPEGLKREEIPIEAQIVSLADTYDLLVSERVYKTAVTKEEAFDMIMEGECGIFSPRLLEIFQMVRMELEEVLEEMAG